MRLPIATAKQTNYFIVVTGMHDAPELWKGYFKTKSVKAYEKRELF